MKPPVCIVLYGCLSTTPTTVNCLFDGRHCSQRTFDLSTTRIPYQICHTSVEKSQMLNFKPTLRNFHAKNVVFMQQKTLTEMPDILFRLENQNNTNITASLQERKTLTNPPDIINRLKNQVNLSQNHLFGFFNLKFDLCNTGIL